MNYEQLEMFPRFKARGVKGLQPTIQRAALQKKELTYTGSVSSFARNSNFRAIPPEVGSRKARALKRKGKASFPTIFEEINSVVAFPRGFLLQSSPTLKSRADWPKLRIEIYKGIISALDKALDNDGPVIIPHSSGFDSRLITGLIKKEFSRRSEVYLVCLQPEIDHFSPLKTYLEWDDETWVEIKEPSWGVNYFDRTLDFPNLGRWASGCGRFLYHRYLFDWWVEKAKIDIEKAVIVNGLYFDELLLSSITSVPWFVVYFHFDHNMKWNKAKHVIFPYVEQNIVRCCLGIGFGREEKTEFKKYLLDGLDPKLSCFPNYQFDRDRNMESVFRKICTSGTDYMKARYRSSWVGIRAPLERDQHFPSELSFKDPLLLQYEKAAVCERLVSRGVKLEMRNEI